MAERRGNTYVDETVNEPYVEQEYSVARAGPEHVPSAIRRISWGAIFGGTAVALVAQTLLTLLGVAIGLSVVNPVTEQNALQEVGVGAGIWWIITGLISLFLGGWTAGRLAGMPRRTDAILHGVITWAIVTFVSIFLIVNGAGAIISAPLNAVMQGMQFTATPDAAANAASTTAAAAWWTFFVLLLGGIAAGAGGALGAPKDLPASPGVRRE